MFNSIIFKKKTPNTQHFSGSMHIGIKISTEMGTPCISEQPVVSGKGIYLRCMRYFYSFLNQIKVLNLSL